MKEPILIVDDDQQMRQTLRDLLEEEGFLVDEAKDGEEAFQIMKKKSYGLVFMDIKMPHLDGFLSSTLIEIRKPETEIVFITGFADDDKIKRILNVFPKSSWLKKPADPKKILKIAKKYRERAQKKKQ